MWYTENGYIENVPVLILNPEDKTYEKDSDCSHVQISTRGLRKVSTVKLEQIRTIDKSRLLDRIGYLSQEDLSKVNAALAVSFELS